MNSENSHSGHQFHGMYLNPGSQGFTKIRRGRYVDKTGLIALMNRRIGTDNQLVCVSRPRRFGKSYAAQMLSAYYDCSCDSSALFHGPEIEKDPSYPVWRNKLNAVAGAYMTGIECREASFFPLTALTALLAAVPCVGLFGE